jgi:hypothetical protein
MKIKLETKRDVAPILSNSEIADLRRKWEERNFMEVNQWCQVTKCTLDIKVTEIESQKKFKTVITIIDEQGLLTEQIESEGIGSNKKESKTNAMRALMNRLIDTNNIHHGIKLEKEKDSQKDNQKDKPKKKEKEKDNSNDDSVMADNIINNSALDSTQISTKLQAILDIENSSDKKISKLFRLMILSLKLGLFSEAFDCLEKIIEWKRTIDWLDISNVFLYLLESKDLRLITTFFEFLKNIVGEDGENKEVNKIFIL